MGLILGGATGIALGFAMGDDENCFFCFTAEQNAFVFGMMLGTSGTLVGAILGTFRPGERWERVQLPRAVSIAPSRNLLALSAAVGF
jgi:hypothetical protein